MSSLVIPNIVLPSPSQAGPSPYPDLEELQRHSLEWLKSFGFLQQEDALQTYLKTNASEFIRLCYRGAGLSELFLCSDWFSWGFAHDYVFDDCEPGTEQEKNYQQLLALLQNPFAVTPQGQLAEALADILQRARSLTSPNWIMRVIQHFRDFVASYFWKAENRALQRIPDRATYIEMRRSCYGAIIHIDLIELVLHREIPDKLYASESIQKIIEYAANIFCWCNDIYSIKKELAQHNVNNLIVILQYEQGRSLQDALYDVCAMIHSEAQHFQARAEALTRHSVEVESIQKYVDYLCYGMQAVLTQWVGALAILARKWVSLANRHKVVVTALHWV